MPSGSYASAIFQSLPTDASIPNFSEEPLVTDVSSDAKAFAIQREDGNLAPAVIEAPVVIEPEAMALPTTTAESLGGQTSVDPVPIPELAEWGAQALAALGDQAGVAISPLAPAPELAATSFVPVEPAPPPVSDPSIEEAFAFLPPPPPAEIDPTPARDTSAAGVAMPSKHTLMMSSVHQPLEDDLIDDPHEPNAIMANAFEAPVGPSDVHSGTSAGATDLARPGVELGENLALEATAFVAEEEASAAEWAPPRLAHAMAAPEAEQIRGPRTRTARRSSADPATREHEDGLEVGPSRTRRVAIIIAVVAGLAGAVAAAALTVRPVGKKSPRPALMGQPSRPAKAVAPSLPSAPPPARVGAAPAAGSLSAVVAPTVATGKKAASSSVVSVPIASKPDGATVWIDGEERGRTPCTVKLKPGSARLVLVHAGHLTSQLAIEVSEGAKIDATLKLAEPPMAGEARFRTECKTQGKLPVVVDDKETGILCPYSKMRVEPGTHTIGVLVPSTGKVHTKEITLSAGVRSINFGD
jgi:hypothetical protein